MAPRLRVPVAASSMFFFLSVVRGARTKHQITSISREASLETAWSAELEGSIEGNPIVKVVNLLKDIKGELDYEATHEGEMYEKQVCWCETTTKEKEKAIADANVREEELTGEIAERTAADKDLATSKADTKSAIDTSEKAKEKAVDLREREAAEARATQKDLAKAISNLKNAIVVLSRGLDFAQLDPALLSSLHTVLHDAALQRELLQKDEMLEHGSFASKLQAAFLAFNGKVFESSEKSYRRALLAALDVQGPGAADVLPVNLASDLVEREATAVISRSTVKGEFLQTNMAQSSNLVDGDILDMCKRLLKELESDLSKSKADEDSAVKAHKSLIKAKDHEIKTSKDKLDELEQEFAINEKKLADAKEDKDLLIQARDSDTKLLANVKKTCANLDAEWETRSKSRSDEIKAVSQAIAVLTEDDSMDVMRRATTFFVQEGIDNVEALELKTRRRHVVEFLRGASKAPEFRVDDLLESWHSLRGDTPSATATSAPLAILAVHAQIDGFKKVKDMMDKMIADLKKEQEVEKAMKADCTTNINEDLIKIKKLKMNLKDGKGKLTQSEELLTTLRESMAKKRQETDETELAVKKAAQDREAENAQYQKVVADQRATQEVLKKALSALEGYYKKSKAALLEQTPPVQFSGKRKANAGGSAVISLLQATIEDSEKLEKEASASEAQAQANYEKFVNDSNDVIKKLSEGITNNKQDSADAQTGKIQAKDDLQEVQADLKDKKQSLADVRFKCDWTLANFDIRQEARLKEIEAIQKAKGILSGAGSK